MRQTGNAFGPAFRKRARWLVSAALLGAAAIPFLFALAALSYTTAGETRLGAMAVTALGFGAASLSLWAVRSRLSLAGNTQLRRQVASALGDDLPGDAIFVGFSPGADLRSWDGDTDRDVGFLTITDGAIVYRGDSYSWSLRRDAIYKVEATPPMAPVTRAIVRWRVPGEPMRAFTLASRDAATLSEAAARTRELTDTLQAWTQRADDPPQDAPRLGLPPTDLSGSFPLDKAPGGACVSLLSVTAMAVLIAWYAAQRMIAAEAYYHAALWVGLVISVAVVFTAQVLAYLQRYDARFPSHLRSGSRSQRG